MTDQYSIDPWVRDYVLANSLLKDKREARELFDQFADLSEEARDALHSIEQHAALDQNEGEESIELLEEENFADSVDDLGTKRRAYEFQTNAALLVVAPSNVRMMTAQRDVKRFEALRKMTLLVRWAVRNWQRQLAYFFDPRYVRLSVDRNETTNDVEPESESPLPPNDAPILSDQSSRELESPLPPNDAPIRRDQSSRTTRLAASIHGAMEANVRLGLDWFLAATFVLLIGASMAVCLGLVFSAGPIDGEWSLWGGSYALWCKLQIGLLWVFSVSLIGRIALHWCGICQGGFSLIRRDSKRDPSE